MKTVLISIKEKFWRLILSGEKSLEIRKARPKDIEYPFRVICYISGRGIMGAFICDGVIKTNNYPQLAESSCLSVGKLFEYANGISGRSDNCLYGWHVEKGTPVEFDTVLRIETAGLNRPPQSWCYIGDYTANKVAYSFDGESYSCTYNNTKEALKDALFELESMKKYPPARGTIPNKIFIGQCEVFKPSLSGSGYDAIDAVQCQAAEEGGEYGEDYLSDVTKEQVKELENALEVAFQAWIEKHNLYPNFYTVPSFSIYTYDGEKIITEGDLTV